MQSILNNDISIFETRFFLSGGETFLADHPHEECREITSACDGISGPRDAAVTVEYLDDDDDDVVVHEHRFTYEGSGILGFESALRREILEGFISCNPNTKRVRVITEILP